MTKKQIFDIGFAQRPMEDAAKVELRNQLIRSNRVTFSGWVPDYFGIDIHFLADAAEDFEFSVPEGSVMGYVAQWSCALTKEQGVCPIAFVNIPSMDFGIAYDAALHSSSERKIDRDTSSEALELIVRQGFEKLMGLINSIPAQAA